MTNKIEHHSKWKQGTDFLQCKYPIISGAMSYISEANLVLAVSKAGGFGVLAGSMFSEEGLLKEIQKIQQYNLKNFAVNLILLHPRIQQLIDICINAKVGYIVLAGGIPDQKTIKKIKDHNIKVIAFAPSLLIAKKMVKYGVDALIVEGHEAGGHIGPTTTVVLAQEILPNITEIPVFVGGGIATGSAIASFINMGASGVQIGTLFVCTNECIAHPNFKEAFVKAKSRHAEVTIQIDSNFPVIPVRAIANKGTKDFLETQKQAINDFYSKKLSKEEAILKIETYWSGALKRAVIDGDIEYGSLMAGQSVGFVDGIYPTQEIIKKLIKEAI